MDKQSASVADARVDELWTTLDMRKQGYLDIAGLRKGLRKLDHRTCEHAVGTTCAKGALQL
jgi:solute carrier family 25 phosphate transporter 23/24/25/41